MGATPVPSRHPGLRRFPPTEAGRTCEGRPPSLSQVQVQEMQVYRPARELAGELARAGGEALTGSTRSPSPFWVVKCPDCSTEQNIFSRPATAVNCGV